MGLVTAMREWRPERGAFPAFAQQCVKNKALLAVISASRHKHQALNLAVSLEENVRRRFIGSASATQTDRPAFNIR